MSDPTAYRDPWAKREAWRKHPVFSRRAQLKAMFPGLGIATVAFTAYLFVDYLVHPASLEKLKQEAVKGASEPKLLDAVRGRGQGQGSGQGEDK